MHKPKYIFVTGGVMSGLGKGVITASISKLLQLCDLKVSCMKIDPYLNFDAGTMNPLIHGEVFVTNDGGECDMDIGNYERFLGKDLTKEHNITTGQIYYSVIERERRGEYLGECVQIIPHITNEIKDRIKSLAEKEMLDILVVECGGTVGDIESLPFLEAMRQMRLEGNDTLFIHVTLAPMLDVVGEIKTKPTQHSVQELRRIGIQPDIIAVRSKIPLDDITKKKIALFANVEEDSVISSHDVSSIYKVPEILEEQGIVNTLSKKLGYENRFHWNDWKSLADKYDNLTDVLKIAMVGKYVKLSDSYVSVNHALEHAGLSIGCKISIDRIDSETLEDGIEKLDRLNDYDGILVPGGFGKRGSEGIIKAADYARENNIPYLGICFGFQLAIVAFARSICGLENANSTELEPNTKDPVVDLLPEQKEIDKLGGTMRLGAHDIDIIKDTLAYKLYKNDKIVRRHRHRYEFNQAYKGLLEKEGMIFSAYSDNGRRAEILEVKDHPFYFAVQYHAEFSSKFGKPEEAFVAFVNAAKDNK
ncbi:MAG: CTP synthetase [Candidatus Nitrosocaldaceae archaeon]|nr:MAG: CTP synthetase [Candidatus Nitrosocaldaceae archaeon]